MAGIPIRLDYRVVPDYHLPLPRHENNTYPSLAYREACKFSNFSLDDNITQIASDSLYLSAEGWGELQTTSFIVWALMDRCMDKFYRIESHEPLGDWAKAIYRSVSEDNRSSSSVIRGFPPNIRVKEAFEVVDNGILPLPDYRDINHRFVIMRQFGYVRGKYGPFNPELQNGTGAEPAGA